MTFLIAIRHAEHKNNILSEKTKKWCTKEGTKLINELKKRNIKLPTLAISSNEQRSIQTLKYILKGMKLDFLPIIEFEEFGDFKSGKFPYTQEEYNRASTEAKKNNDNNREKYLLLLYPKRSEKRGKEAVAVLKKIIKLNNENIIFCSHGCSRLEQIISVFKKQPVDMPEFIFERGGIALLNFKTKPIITLKKVEYLGKL